MNTRRNKRQIESDTEPTIENEPVDQMFSVVAEHVTRDAFDALEPSIDDQRAPIDSTETAGVVVNHEEQHGVLDRSTTGLDKSSPKYDKSSTLGSALDKSTPKVDKPFPVEAEFEEATPKVDQSPLDSELDKSTPEIDAAGGAGGGDGAYVSIVWGHVDAPTNVDATTPDAWNGGLVEPIEPPVDAVLVNNEDGYPFDGGGDALLDDALDG